MPALDELAELLNSAYGIFQREKAVVSVESPCVMFIGDLHGNLKALELILGMKDDLEDTTLVFLGDYVDRGPDSIAVLSRLLRFKIAEPENIILLRGNHESMEMNISYGFFYDLDFNDELLGFADSVFRQMPVAAVVNDNIFCVHGGIPGPVDINDISKEDAFEYLWNDPSSVPGITASVRGIRPKCFGEDVFIDFMGKNEFSLMIRGHSAAKEGYEWWFGKRLLSIFSTPEYCGNPTRGAFAILDTEKININVFGPRGNKKHYDLL